MTDKQERPKKGPKSFCIPRAAIEALLDAKADAYTICAYLTLANYTDPSGVYSSAGVRAVNTSTGGSKVIGCPISRAIQRLKEIHAFKIENVPNGKSGKSHALTQKKIDLGPILFDRDTWIQRTGEILPDGTTERSLIRHILPTFGEPLIDRVWFGSAIVEGFGKHKQPLKDLKNLGSVEARLLLVMYAATDMETWGGVSPVGVSHGPFARYEPADGTRVINDGSFTLIRAQHTNTTMLQGDLRKIWSQPPENKIDFIDAHNKAGGPCWKAINNLESFGFFYQSVVVLNRNPTPDKQIPDDAEPLYELYNCSLHGTQPKGEEGLGKITAQTAGELGYPVTTPGGVLDGTYAAIVKRGQGAMIVGIYRPRYRVSNHRNAGVKGTWTRILENNRDYYNFIENLRWANGLPPLSAPWTTERVSTPLESGESIEAIPANLVPLNVSQ